MLVGVCIYVCLWPILSDLYRVSPEYCSGFCVCLQSESWGGQTVAPTMLQVCESPPLCVCVCVCVCVSNHCIVMQKASRVGTQLAQTSKECNFAHSLTHTHTHTHTHIHTHHTHTHAHTKRCNKCHELLVDLVHYLSPDHEGLYCGRHHLELLVPRCAGCDEV